MVQQSVMDENYYKMFDEFFTGFTVAAIRVVVAVVSGVVVRLLLLFSLAVVRILTAVVSVVVAVLVSVGKIL